MHEKTARCELKLMRDFPVVSIRLACMPRPPFEERRSHTYVSTTSLFRTSKLHPPKTKSNSTCNHYGTLDWEGVSSCRMSSCRYYTSLCRHVAFTKYLCYVVVLQDRGEGDNYNDQLL